MAKLIYRGINPLTFSESVLQGIVSVLNDEGTNLESELVRDSPANFGRLKGGWVFSQATTQNPRAIIGQSVKYFLPVEMGRSPGKGISKKGQIEVARWAKLVMGIRDKKSAKSFAYMLSQKYKRMGRPSVGFVGLAVPGKIPSKSSSVPKEPIRGSLLDKAFTNIRKKLDKV